MKMVYHVSKLEAHGGWFGSGAEPRQVKVTAVLNPVSDYAQTTEFLVPVESGKRLRIGDPVNVAIGPVDDQ